jgi:hypothetical protein
MDRATIRAERDRSMTRDEMLSYMDALEAALGIAVRALREVGELADVDADDRPTIVRSALDDIRRENISVEWPDA